MIYRLVIIFLLVPSFAFSAGVIFQEDFENNTWTAGDSGHRVTGGTLTNPGSSYAPDGWTGYIKYGSNSEAIGVGYGRSGGGGFRVAPEYGGVTNQVGITILLPDADGDYSSDYGYEELYIAWWQKYSDNYKMTSRATSGGSRFTYQKILRVWQDIDRQLIVDGTDGTRTMTSEKYTGWLVWGVSDDDFGSFDPRFYRMAAEDHTGDSNSGNGVMMANYTWQDSTSGGFLENHIGTIAADGSFPAQDWHHYEIHIKAASSWGATDGVFELWVDGIKQDSTMETQAGADYPTAALGEDYHPTVKKGLGYNYITLWDNADTYDWSEQAYVYIDDFVVSTAYIDPSYVIPSSPNITCYPDIDNDLYPGTGSESVTTCSTNYYESSHFTAMTIDCDDTDPLSYPGAGSCASSVATPLRAGAQITRTGTTPIRLQ